MGWDASRAVPWARLAKEWLVYAAIMAVVFVLFFRDGSLIGILAGLFISGPLYLALGFVLAKFGYQRKTLAELRTPRAAPASTPSAGARTPPAPTRRTAGGTNRRPGSRSGRKHR